MYSYPSDEARYDQHPHAATWHMGNSLNEFMQHRTIAVATKVFRDFANPMMCPHNMNLDIL